MVGVVPGLQVLEQQNEVDGVLGHSSRICPRCRHRRASGDVLVERQLAPVTTEQLHRSARLRLRRQLRDQSARDVVARGQVQPVEQRREAAVHGDLLGVDSGHTCAKRRGQPARRQRVNAVGNRDHSAITIEFLRDLFDAMQLT
jgi:hypothetical protein